jgi:hypothetical protein
MADKPGHNERSAPGSASSQRRSAGRGEPSMMLEPIAQRGVEASLPGLACFSERCENVGVETDRRRHFTDRCAARHDERGRPASRPTPDSRGRGRRQGRPRRQPWSFCSHSCVFLKKSVGQISCGDNIGTPRVTGPVVRHRQRVAVLASSTASVDAVVENQRSRLQAIKRPRPGPGRMRRRGRFRFAASRGQCRIAWPSPRPIGAGRRRRDAPEA